MVRCLAVVALMILAGCTSMSSTLLTRNECNTAWNKIPRLKGVPITLKVPTHLKVYVYDAHFLNTGTGEFVKASFPIRDFGTEYVYSEKIFTVDFKRPAAGIFNLDLELSDEQYIKKISHDVTDQTIEKVGGLISSLGDVGFSLASASDSKSLPEGQIHTVRSVAAVAMFEIEDPLFEEKIAEFVNCHLNQAHDAWVVPEGTRIHRTHIADEQVGEIQPLCEGCPDGGRFSASGEFGEGRPAIEYLAPVDEILE